MRKLNKNKGITLISLVITIIVMLILVGVSISMAVNGGLFNYAGKAVGETKKELNEENNIGNGGVKVDGTTFTSINDYIEETKKKTIKFSIQEINGEITEYEVKERNNMGRIFTK